MHVEVGAHNQAQSSKFSAGVVTIIGKLLVTVNRQVGHVTWPNSLLCMQHVCTLPFPTVLLYSQL